ncbi:polysaccharide deacetylase [Alsobacter metallidurans]|uniref:Polysaccharide deacetylase n=1 Tax=Alsobacter metallidurans TaxID=340221 RepID=A0A917I9T4_9HYPH|nr:polysaccharide deacetylase family protein [Alsobacter metallidurans]GGH25716.1 polysaccharide deacetylase [Alsobacter metallidurans]
MRHHDRYDYHPLPHRADYSWPEGRRLAVYLALNLEHFSFGEGLGAELAPAGPHPDVLNYAWRDYGNRAGAWRLLRMFDDLQLPCSVLLNTSMYDYAPDLVDAFRRRGDEMVGHGRTNSERQGVMAEADEKALIAGCTHAMLEREGRAPQGWLGPWISQSATTPDLLAEAGYGYLLDWCHDDQPVWFRTRGGRRILSVPYPQELNDIPQIVGRKREGAEFADMIVDSFDELLEESRDRPLVMGVALHAYLVGWPHRARHLRRALRHIRDRADGRVWITTAGAIARHAASLPPGVVPGA